MTSFKEDGPIYNWKQSKGESVSELLGIDFKPFYNGGFQYDQTGLIHEVLEATRMDHCIGLPRPTEV